MAILTAKSASAAPRTRLPSWHVLACECCGCTPEDEEEQRDLYRIGTCATCLEKDDEKAGPGE
ncbi:hypothetical protein OPKNFCMD_0012 [Methylobacterium crusticola]|uniref:DksA C4-type domain-containing protein n=1 Tax=Methylobacterium crusticola TaxID=1697972 RepID=A0ABQ4QQG3_9HYPH|nr:hypothetical protein [Methylobacterium crusticola]GJD47306.1 hypothetical protein OPKNFCMD_0012 [Methylobacterium crusticola]